MSDSSSLTNNITFDDDVFFYMTGSLFVLFIAAGWISVFHQIVEYHTDDDSTTESQSNKNQGGLYSFIDDKYNLKYNRTGCPRQTTKKKITVYVILMIIITVIFYFLIYVYMKVLNRLHGRG